MTEIVGGRFDGVSESRLLIVDYSVKPSLVGFDVIEHPERKDVATIDLGKVSRVLVLRDGEGFVKGEENFCRLKKRAEETGELLLDIRVLEEILFHPHLIPEEWKSGVTYFWGTIFRGAYDHRCVSYLIRYENGWYWNYNWLESNWNSRGPAAVLRK
jgi:hypothetical protein